MKVIKHKWRKLPIQKRLKIPINYFNLNAKTIQNIRKISDPKQRLIKAAKLQYESFKDIHTDLTAWIAGYASDVIVRQKFGSSKNLRELFIPQQIKNKKIKPSWMDTKRNIKIPEEINEDLAEEIGIHIGDGNINIYKQKSGGKSYHYSIYGNLREEIIYHEEYISNLFKKLYNFRGYKLLNKKRNCISSHFKSKALIEYKNKILKLPIGSKKEIEIPKQILKDKNLQKRVIIGIIDTDFYLNYYNTIRGTLTSLRIIKQMCNIFKNLNIPFSCKIIKNNYGRIHIKSKGTQKILEEWKLSNIKNISKYKVWKEFKKYLPYTHTEERLALLKGYLNIDFLEKISQKRKIDASKVKTLPVKL